MTFRADLSTQADPPNPEVKVLMVGSSQSTHKPSGACGQWGWAPSLAGQSRWRPLCCKGVGTGQTQSHRGRLPEAVRRAGHLKGLPAAQRLGERKATDCPGRRVWGRNAHLKAAGCPARGEWVGPLAQWDAAGSRLPWGLGKACAAQANSSSPQPSLCPSPKPCRKTTLCNSAGEARGPHHLLIMWKSEVWSPLRFSPLARSEGSEIPQRGQQRPTSS